MMYSKGHIFRTLRIRDYAILAVIFSLAAILFCTSLKRVDNSSYLAPSATSVYISQNAQGANNGMDCNDAHSTAWFNSSGNWGTGSSQIGPGTTVYLCGTISVPLEINGSGTPQNPITIYFEPGAMISMPDCPWGGYPGCISTNYNNYIVINGGKNGIIQNTREGTGMWDNGTVGVQAFSCSNCTIENLTIRNMYIRTSYYDTNVDQTLIRCIDFSGSNLIVRNNVCYNAGWAFINSYNNGDTNVRVYNNTIYNIDHGYTLSSEGPNVGGSFYFYDNHVYNFSDWDSPNDAYHHDGVHAFGVYNSSDGTYPSISQLWIYDNLFNGMTGNNMNSFIFTEGNGPYGTPWDINKNTKTYIFNNVFISSSEMVGLLDLSEGNLSFYNNVVIGNSSEDNNNICVVVNQITHFPKIQNNFIANCNVLLSLTTNFSVPNVNNYINNNLYANCGNSYNCWWWNSTDVATFSVWKSGCHCDSNSIATLNTNGGINNVTGFPLAKSPVIANGLNLENLGIAALDYDKAGIQRPPASNWDIGAYQYSSGGTTTTYTTTSTTSSTSTSSTSTSSTSTGTSTSTTSTTSTSTETSTSIISTTVSGGSSTIASTASTSASTSSSTAGSTSTIIGNQSSTTILTISSVVTTKISTSLSSIVYTSSIAGQTKQQQDTSLAAYALIAIIAIALAYSILRVRKRNKVQQIDQN